MATKSLRQTLPLPKETGKRARRIDTEPILTALSDRFTALRKVRESGGITLFRAEGPQNGRQVLLEVLSESDASDYERVKLFYLEAEAAARLRHPYIVKAHLAEPLAGTHLRVCEYLPEAETLRELLSRRGWIEPARAARVIAQVAGALDYAHCAGVLHLNLQPENILLDLSGEAFLIGFGIGADESLEWPRRARAARCAPPYLSPEQVNGKAGDRASDLYLLGVVLYESLTDRVPFDSNDLAYLRRRHRFQSPQPPHNFRPEIPLEMSNLVMALLSRNPEARSLFFGHAEHFTEALKAACETRITRNRTLARGTNPMPLYEIAGELIAQTAQSAAHPAAAPSSLWRVLANALPWSRHLYWLTLLVVALLPLTWFILPSPQPTARHGNRMEQIAWTAPQTPSGNQPIAELTVEPGSAARLGEARDKDGAGQAVEQGGGNPAEADNQVPPVAGAPPATRPRTVAEPRGDLSSGAAEAGEQIPAPPPSRPLTQHLHPRRPQNRRMSRAPSLTASPSGA
jgi:serine/threonine-protein kinase